MKKANKQVKQQPKYQLTKQYIASRLGGELSFFSNIILCVGIICLSASIISLPFSLLLLPVGGFLIYLSIKKRKQHQKTAQNVSYRIIRTTCIECTSHWDHHNNGTTYSQRFTYEPEHGITTPNREAKPGDIVYLVHAKEPHEIKIFFNEKKFTPAPDLVIEEMV